MTRGQWAALGFFIALLGTTTILMGDIRIDGGGTGGPETDPIAGPALTTHAALSKEVHSIADTSKLLTSESDPNSLHLNGDNSMTGDITCLTDGSCDIGSKDSGTTKLRPDKIWAKSSVSVGDTTEITDQEVWIGKESGETGTIKLGPEGTKLEHILGGDPRVVKLTLGSPGHAEFQLGQIGSFWGFSPSLERWKFSNSARNLILDHDAGGGVDSQNKITMYNPPKTQSLTWGFAAPWDGVAYRWVMSTSAGDLNLVPAEGDGAVNVNKYAGKIGTLNLGPGGASIVGTAAGSLTLSPASGQTTTVHGLVEEIERTYSGVADATYTLVRKARFARQIDKVVFLCSLASGIITADLKIDGTAIDGCNALGVTDIEQDFTCTNNATNDLAAATTLTLVTSSNVLCGDLIVGVQTTRD